MTVRWEVFAVGYFWVGRYARHTSMTRRRLDGGATLVIGRHLDKMPLVCVSPMRYEGEWGKLRFLMKIMQSALRIVQPYSEA